MKGSVEASPGLFRGFGRCALNASSPHCQPAHQGPIQPVFGAPAEGAGAAVNLMAAAGGSQSCSTAPGAYACAPAMPWAWSDGSPLLSKVRDAVTVQASINIGAPPTANRTVFVSSQTFAVGVARAADASDDLALLSLRAGGSAFVDLPECALRVGAWHRVAVSFRLSDGPVRSVIPTVYLNGSAVQISRRIPVPAGFGVALASEGGLAVGRDFPTAEYLTNVNSLADDATSYFHGWIAELRLWGVNASGAVLRSTGKPCQETYVEEGLLACYDFNRTLNDSLQQASLLLRAGDRYRPWCTTVDDGGEFMFHPHVSTNIVYDMGERWGFCTQQYTLPSRERSYDPVEMARVEQMPTADLLARYSGCGRVPLMFVNNRALTRYGGAIYLSSDQSSKSDDTTCLLGLPAGLTPALQIIVSNNSAGAAGGAIYFDSPSIPEACTGAFGQRLGLPSPHSDYKLLFRGNTAGGWGDELATQPSRMLFVSGSREYVPGIDAIDLVVGLEDALGQTVRGSASFANPYVIELLPCVPNAACSDLNSLGPGSFYQCNQSGLCRTRTKTTLSSVLCLANRSEAAVILSCGSLAPVEVALRCLPCEPGQHMQLQEGGGTDLSLLASSFHTWSCISCLEGQYIIDPQKDSCQNCPSGILKGWVCLYLMSIFSHFGLVVFSV